MPHKKSVLITFPTDGTRANDIAKGTHTFDFEQGTYTNQAGTVTILTDKLINSGQEFIRSMYIFCEQSVILEWIGDTNGQMFLDNGVYWIFEGLNLKRVIITISSTLTPDQNDFQIFASSNRKLPVRPVGDLVHVTRAVSAAFSSTSYATAMERRTDAYRTYNLLLHNDGASNECTVRVEVQDNATSTWIPLELNAAGDTDVVLSAAEVINLTVEIPSKWMRVRGKNTVSSQNSQLEIQYQARS